jgi:beta-glucanase (GH16 family)
VAAVSTALPRGDGEAASYSFADEFDGPAGAPPDPARWRHDLGGGGWGNGELQVYTDSPANAYQDGQGHLVIAATREGGSWTSARLKTEGLFSQQGGSWQARIRLNPTPGFWPAWWMLGADNSTVGWPRCGEADIMENYGAGWTDSSVHCPDDRAAYAVFTQSGGLGSGQGWHVYQLDWAGNRMDFSRDGRRYLTVTAGQFPAGSWVFGENGGCFMLLNMAVGGKGPGMAPPSSTRLPVTMLVDYVRAWAS